MQGVVRDQSESSFTTILGGLVARMVGAEAAALVDRDGETVDYSGEGQPNDIRIAAAHWAIVLSELRAQTSWASLSWFFVQAERASFLVQALPEGYALVVRLAAGLASLRFDRALSAAAIAMAHEAGWAFERSWVWRPVEVTVDDAGRPTAVRFGTGEQSVEVLGRYPEALENTGSLQERAWRVRVAFGAEATLVREGSGFWYADEPLEELATRGDRTQKTPVKSPSHIFQTTRLTGPGS